jgi:hypothetical protein
MANLALISALIFAACLPARSAVNLKPFQVLRLPETKAVAGACGIGWKRELVPGRVLLLDEQHVVVSEHYFCRPSSRGRAATHGVALIVFDKTGQSHSTFIPGASDALRTASEALVINRRKGVDVLDAELRTEQSLECPVKDADCVVYEPGQRPYTSDFAVCSRGKGGQDCDFYQGLPARKISQRTIEKNDWHMGPYGWLTIPNDTIPPERVPDNAHCAGAVSILNPERLLYACRGAYVYTDGELDALFGYAKIGLFEFPSGRLLAQINLRSFNAVGMSPSGAVIAVWRRREVYLYRVN